MRYLRLTGRPDPAVAPPLFGRLADSVHASEARLLGWNSAGDRMTLLLAVAGDREPMAAGLAGTAGVLGVEAAPLRPGRFFLLLHVDRSAVPLMEAIFGTLVRAGLVVVTPVVYRDGAARARLVGETGAVQAAMAGLPDAVEVTIHEIGEGGLEPGAAAGVTALSDRQREAVLAALDLGYYDRPRRATHEDVAARLGCAASTASEHLQKAEAKLVRAAMAGE